MNLSQIELVWVRVRVEWECFWVNLREDNKVSESKMAVSEDYMVKFKMAAIMILSQNEWVKILCANGGNQSCQMWLSLRVKTKMAESKMSKFKMAEFRMAAITKLCQNEWVKFFCKWWDPILASVSEFERKNYDGRIQDGIIEDGCLHQVRWEWMSLNQIELLWDRVRVEWECFWVNLKEDNKVSESKMALSGSNMAEFKMAAIIKLIQNEWVKFFCANGGNQSWQVWVTLRRKTKMAESKMAKFKMAEFKMAAIIRSSENEWVWARLN